MSRSDTDTDGELTPGSGNGRGAMVPLGERPLAVPAMAWPYGAPLRPEILTAKPGVVELLHALRRRWLLAIGLGVAVGGLLFAVVWALVPVKFEAVAMLRVAENQYVTNIDSTSHTDYQGYKKTQAELVRSTWVVTKALRVDPKIANLPTLAAQKDPVTWLHDQLLVDYPGDSEVLRVALKGDRLDDLAPIVNAVKDAYLAEVVAKEKDEMLVQYASLQRTFAGNDKEIERKGESKRSLEKLTGPTGSDRWEIEHKIQKDSLEMSQRVRDDYVRQMRDVALRYSLVQEQIKLLEGQEIPDAMIEAEASKDNDIRELKVSLRGLRLKLSTEATIAKNPDTAPTIQELKGYIAKLEGQIEDRKKELKEEMLARMTDIGSAEGPTISVPMLKKQYEMLRSLAATTDQEVKQKLKDIQETDKYSADYARVKGELTQLEATNVQLDQKIKSLKIGIDNYRARVTEFEKAYPPKASDALRKYLGSIFAGLFGFVAMVLGVAWIEFQSRRLNTARDVNEGLGVRVLGHLPNLSGRAWRRMIGGGGDDGSLQAMLIESIDSIRATLMHCATVTAPKVVLVTSAEPKEGKTTVASQLAASLARAGRSTLLVDADVRGPALHLVFDLPLEPGVCDVLRGTATREQVVQPTQQPNLFVVPAGRCDMLSIQALSSEVVENLLDAWRAEYDFVIIDSRAVLHVADPLLLGQHVDAAVLSAQRDVSKVPKVYEACERLSAVGVTVLGVVVNGVNERAAGHALVPQTIEAA